MSGENKIALLYFSRKTQDEGKMKQWLGRSGDSGNHAIAAALITHSFKAVAASGLPVFHYTNDKQKGDTFGQRLANAYEDIFNQGYSAVIAVGNDTPELSVVNWQQAIRLLQAGLCVLGPSIRGGAYFIGLTHAAFRKNDFQNLSWKTKDLFRDLHAYCVHLEGQPHLLTTLRDVNTLNDLLALVRQKGIARNLSRFILRIIFKKNLTSSFSFNRLLSFCTWHASLRGPPALA